MKARQSHAPTQPPGRPPGSGTTDRALQQRIKPLPSDPTAQSEQFRSAPRWVPKKPPADGRQGSGTWMEAGRRRKRA